MSGVKNNLPLGWRRIRALAAGDNITDGDNSGDVDIGRAFEAVVLDFVKDEKGDPVVYQTDGGLDSYIYKIRIEEKSDESATGNEMFVDPSTFSNLSDVVGDFFEDAEQARKFYVNMHPEGVYINDDPAKETPKIGDAVNATSGRIQGRYIITAKFGSAANKEGGYVGSSDSSGKGAREVVDFKGNGIPVFTDGQLFLKNSSVKWDCVDPEVKAAVLSIAEKTGLPITVTSGYRDAKDTAAVGSTDRSQHRFGQAVDIRTRDKTQEELHLIKEAAQQAGFDSPPPLQHGTGEHFHFELVKNKGKASSATGCAEKIAKELQDEAREKKGNS